MIIDISEFNGNVDFSQVKGSVEGVIIRAGYRGYSAGNIKTDAKAVRNIQGAAPTVTAEMWTAPKWSVRLLYSRKSRT